MGQGEGYMFIPEGIVLAVFLSAFAYAGAGGNLNLAQSFYIKAKGYGMGKYAGKITSPVIGKSDDSISPSAQVSFDNNEQNIRRFNIWWKRINIEHGLIFWLTGAVTMTMLAFLAYITTFGQQGTGEGINFVLQEASMIAKMSFPFLGTLFLLIGGITLLATQMVVFESCSRIISENIAIRCEAKNKPYSVRKLFYSSLWGFIFIGIIVLLSGFTEPRALIVLGAVINAFTMLVHLVLTYILNHRELDKVFQPVWYRKAIIWVEIAFFAVFSGIVFWDKIIR